MAALQYVVGGSGWGLPERAAAPSEDLKTLRQQVQRLQRETASQRQLMGILQEQEGGSVERTRQAFELMDTNQDGFISEEEFLRGATQLLNLNAAKNAELRSEVVARFRAGSSGPDGAGTMSFERFCSFLGEMRGDALGPLRLSYAEGLKQLLDVSLQMTALTLSREMLGPELTAERAHELSEYVDTWADIETRSTARLAAGASAEEVEELLAEVSALAKVLSLPSCGNDVGCTVESNARKVVRSVVMAITKFRSSLAFCSRGLQITGQDLWEVGQLVLRWVQGTKLEEGDGEKMRRTVQDVLMLVPYTIIMIVPLSPPGHVFAFSLLNRCFPGAIPSGFTERRQGVHEIYSRIAEDAMNKIRPPLRVGPLRALQRAVFVMRKWLQGVGKWRLLFPGNATAIEEASPQPIVNVSAA